MKRILLCAAFAVTAVGASAQQPPPCPPVLKNPYGPLVNLGTAKKR